MNKHAPKGFILSITLYISIAGGAQMRTMGVGEKGSAESFPLSAPSYATSIYTDAADAAVVQIAATAFSNDIQLITGATVPIRPATTIEDGYAVVIGTMGQSRIVDSVISANKINTDTIRGKWEASMIRIIQQPAHRVKGILLIAGSDRRGTAFGVFDLSRKMGVSPFYWWTDITPAKKKALFVSGHYESGSPAVKYRGIFINDEDWGMQPWAAKHMDTAIKDIGPRTYEKVFELLLRLKANYIWPAMHPCTKAFYYYKESPLLADRYAIVVGGSHCEPMLRNNVFEWAENYEQEYGKKPGEWRYDLNKEEIYKYWDDRVKESVHYESVYTVGMRGVHDGSMPGPKDPNEKLKLLEQVIVDQRKILGTNFNEPAEKIPQIFVPYKEVLSLYRRGLPLADDITIIWPDDNYGYIRQLPNEAERKRSGGHGVYYHLSYWGSPQDYLWLSSISPALISYEMTKAYNAGANKLWVFNVGDIKPAELEIQFSMDLAWNMEHQQSGSGMDYVYEWAESLFGTRYYEEIGSMKRDYYKLAREGKPEQMDAIEFTHSQANARLRDYDQLAKSAQRLYKLIDPSLRDAFYELLLYPILAAKLMNEKILFARSSFINYKTNPQQSIADGIKAKAAFDSIAIITDVYNKQIAGGKWDGMMSWHPRDQKVFNMPVVAGNAMDEATRDSLIRRYQYAPKPALSSNEMATNFEHGRYCHVGSANDVGVSSMGVRMVGDPITGVDSCGVFYELPPLPPGNYEIRVKCLPDFDTDSSKYLRYGIAIDNEPLTIINVFAEAESPAWRQNVVRGYSLGKSIHKISAEKQHVRRTFLNTKKQHYLYICLRDKNLVVNTVEFHKLPDN